MSTDRGWDATLDAAAITAMKAAWVRAHDAYEHVEPIIEPLFPDAHLNIDGRYEIFLEAGVRERQPFTGDVVAGFHAVERILWSDAIPDRVVEFESGIPLGFTAAYPSNGNQSLDFRTKLLNGLLGGCTSLRDRFAAKVDVGLALDGLVAELQGQKDDVNKRFYAQDESRYAQRSMDDLRSGVEGARVVYEAFRPWILEQHDGASIDAKITAGYDALAAAYATVAGDQMPDAPSRWSPLHPTDVDRATPFGALWSAIATASATGTDGSLASEIDAAAVAVGLPAYPEDPP
jgi:iron uptake system component EfeO